LIVILDTGLLGWITNPNYVKSKKYIDWFEQLVCRSATVMTSDLCAYEVERGLFLARKKTGAFDGITLLEDLRNRIVFLPITSELLRESAILWADAQSQSLGTSSPKNIDVDIILCAQYRLLQNEYPGRTVIVATENIRDIGRFANADRWEHITF
jgi:hypothetical protein